VEAFIRLMETDNEVTGPMNLGNTCEFTMCQLADMVIKITGSRSKLVFDPLPVDDPRQRQPDITMARRIIEWEPATSLEEGLKTTIRYFEQLVSLGSDDSPANTMRGTK
jgi:UDP-glucuronate decarboxylase